MLIKRKLSINLTELLSALSIILDAAENRNFGHSRRTAYISYQIAKNLGLSEELINKIYYAAFIHDIGMAGQMSSYSIDEIHNDLMLKREHCKLGSEVIKHLPFDEEVSQLVLFHHEEWNGKGVYGLKGNEIPVGCQIIHIADYFDLNYGGLLEKVNIDSVKEWVDKGKEKFTSSEVTESLLSLMEKDSFWFDLKTINLLHTMNMLDPKHNRIIHMDDLKKIAEAFALLIDSKSKFTYDHSQGIVDITKKIAQYIGYDDFTVNKLEVAAYLHDLGKLVVPNKILEKPSNLTKREFNIIKSHPYYTKLALKQVKGLEDIAEWAGNHHEKLNGGGYPERLNHEELTDKDQIIAIADIYQALTEDRPYRRGLSHDETMQILNSMGDRGFISREIVKILDKIF